MSGFFEELPKLSSKGIEELNKKAKSILERMAKEAEKDRIERLRRQGYLPSTKKSNLPEKVGLEKKRLFNRTKSPLKPPNKITPADKTKYLKETAKTPEKLSKVVHKGGLSTQSKLSTLLRLAGNFLKVGGLTVGFVVAMTKRAGDPMEEAYEILSKRWDELGVSKEYRLKAKEFYALSYNEKVRLLWAYKIDIRKIEKLYE